VCVIFTYLVQKYVKYNTVWAICFLALIFLVNQLFIKTDFIMSM